jgi:8-oxo-dGTP pyrophosphatase MutT (NUDIX family)
MKILEKYLESLMIGQVDKVETEVNVAAAIIMRLDDTGTPEVLLIQRAKEDHWPSHWEFPRGKCDQGPNEKLYPCLKREIKEETGLDVIPVKFINRFEYLADKGTRRSTQYNYLCKMKDPEQPVKLSHEHQDYRWVRTAGEVELMVNAGEMKKSLVKVFDIDHKVVSYPENGSTEKIEE